MHFLTDEEWELRDPILQSLQGAGMRMYPCVEVGINAPLWHLDLLGDWGADVPDGCWRRFILASIEQVAATLAAHDGLFRLHFQEARQCDHSLPYEIRQVKALLEGKDLAGHNAYVVVLPNQRFVYPDRKIEETSLTQVRGLFDANIC